MAAFLWAFDGVLRRSLFALPPVIIVFYEHLIGSLILLPVLFSSRKLIRSLTKKEILNLTWIGLFSGLLGTLWFTTALLKVNFISFSVVFLLQKLQPVFVMLAATVFLKERLTATYFKWAVLAIVAAYFVTFKNGIVNFDTGAGTITAAMYALLAAFAWGTSTVFSKMALQTKPDMLVTGLRFAFTTVFAGVAVLVMGQSAQLTQVDTSQLLRFVIIALSTGMVALALYYKGLAKTEAKVSTILELVFPVSAVLIDAVVYKSFLAPTQLIAAVVLLFAAYKLSLLRGERISFESNRITGKGRGKKMGVPTINLEIPRNFRLREGIYAAYVTVQGKTYQGALHYGPIPTFKEKGASLEVFLLNVKNLPEKVVRAGSIRIDIVQHLRPIIDFSTPEELVQQIELDVQHTKAIL